MYCTRPATRSPSVYRLASPTLARRSPSTSRSASFFPGFPSPQYYGHPFLSRPQPQPQYQVQDPFRSLDRLLEDFSTPSFLFSPQQVQRPSTQTLQRTYQPRFDVREIDGGYELRGEMPGFEPKDVDVEFSDAQTLIIRGRTESESSTGTTPTQEAVQPSAKGKEPAVTSPETEAATETAERRASDAASTYSTGSYQKPSVADSEADEAHDTEAKATPATTPGEQASADQAVEQTPAQQSTEAQQEQSKPQQTRYFINERSTGSFQRVFRFEERVAQDGVTASLKNGILEVVVPKAAVPEPRRILVE